jgi:hypothetical protein
VLAELDASGLADRTIIVLTADHGDMDGAHKLHAKGALALPRAEQRAADRGPPVACRGRQCARSDFACGPGADAGGADRIGEARAAITQGLPGKDFSGLLAAPERAGETPCATALLLLQHVRLPRRRLHSTRQSNT